MSRLQQHTWLLLIMATAIFMRFYRLGDVPPGMSGDELFNAIDAWRVGVEHWPIFFEGNNGREAFFLYLIAASLRLVGQTLFALRLPAALLGSGSVLLAYLIGQEQFNRRAGLLAAGLMAVSLWPIMHSRWGLRAVSLTFFTALTVYLIMRAWQNPNWRNWVGAGLALGLTMYTYIPARLFPVVILAWFGWLLWERREQIETRWHFMALSLLTALIVYAPFGWYTWQYPDRVNQRLHTMTSALDLALDAGEFEPLIQSTLSTLGMFSFAGDGEWRYHVSGKPVFDPITSLFFYAGLLICLWHIFRRNHSEQPRSPFGLLLLWMGAMLVPDAVLDSSPSFLRSAGAIVPVYLITAVGLDRAATSIAKRWPSWEQPYMPLFAVLGLSLILANTWHNYFTVWIQHSEVRYVYHGGMAKIGHFLRQQPIPPETRIFVVDSYAYDTAPQMLPYYALRSSPLPNVSWVKANSGLALPAATRTAESWYLVPFHESLPAPIIDRFDLETVATQHRFENGDTAFTLYRLPTRDLVQSPGQPMDVAFTDGPLLVGYDLPGELVRGDATAVLVHLQIPEEQRPLPNRLLSIQLRLEDAQGNLWYRHSELMGYPQASWRPGDHFLQAVPLELPAGMPPGAAYLRFDLVDIQGQLLSLTGSNRSEPFYIGGQMLVEDFSPPPDMLVLDDTLALQQATFSSMLVPGLVINIALDWVVLRPPPMDYRAYLALVQPGAAEPFYYQTDGLWPDVYPPTGWQTGEQIRTFHQLRAPLEMPTDTAPELRLYLVPPDNDLPLAVTQGEPALATMTLSLREHLFEIPAIPVATEAQFGDSIRLLGYDLATDQSAAGDTLKLTLYWQAVTTPVDNYTVFNHIVGAEGQIVGQYDGPPTGEAWLTATWLPGEVIIDEREIPIEPTATNGRYALAIGLYTAGDGVRLPIQVNDVLQPQDQLILTEIEVR
jgi:4-amino-4-deoxy-L-arabinose transferase-like glycosyltransferase